MRLCAVLCSSWLVASPLRRMLLSPGMVGCRAWMGSRLVAILISMDA